MMMLATRRLVFINTVTTTTNSTKPITHLWSRGVSSSSIRNGSGGGYYNSLFRRSYNFSQHNYDGRGCGRRLLSSDAGTTTTIGIVHPHQHRQVLSKQERMTHRAGRKERAAQVLQQAKGGNSVDGATTTSSSTVASMAQGVGGSSTTNTTNTRRLASSKYIWYASIGIPTALLVWGLNDSTSPPAQLSKMIGLTGLIQQYTDAVAKPTHDKLLPDWSQVRMYVCRDGRMDDVAVHGLYSTSTSGWCDCIYNLSGTC
jgi:hypothetical protein